MECVNLKEEMDKAKRKIDLFGTDNFRSWLLYFVPGDGTDMHYHANPETFLVFSGNGVVKGLKGEERADQEGRRALPGGQGLLPDRQYRQRAVGAVRQPLGSVRRSPYPGRWQRPAASIKRARNRGFGTIDKLRGE